MDERFNPEQGEEMREGQLVIFTDLDGTLLNYKDYSYQPAMEALRKVAEQQVPTVFVTSKTLAEVEHLKSLLAQDGVELKYPAIVENGAGIFIPKDFFDFEIKPEDVPGMKIEEKDDYIVLEFGNVPYDRLQEVLHQDIAPQLGKEKVVGFGDMSAEQLAEHSSLPSEQAELAKKRIYDEPFYVEPEATQEDVEKMKELIAQKGLQYIPGRRYHHISNRQDKGMAAEVLMGLLKKKYGEIVSLGLGDSEADRVFMDKCDQAQMVHKERGPAEWNEIILKRLEENKTSLDLQSSSGH